MKKNLQEERRQGKNEPLTKLSGWMQYLPVLLLLFISMKNYAQGTWTAVATPAPAASGDK